MRTKINPSSPKKKETFETPKNFFCFINNTRMTTSDCFEYAENPHVNEILTKKIPESKISTPPKSFNHPRHLKSNPIKQNLQYYSWYANVLLYFSGVVHTAQESVASYPPKMVSPSLREYPICNCVHSYSISRMRTKWTLLPPSPPHHQKNNPRGLQKNLNNTWDTQEHLLFHQ